MAGTNSRQTGASIRKLPDGCPEYRTNTGEATDVVRSTVYTFQTTF